MALWNKIRSDSGPLWQQVQGIYGPNFPLEVRHFMADWIEEKMWTDIDPTNPQHEEYVKELMSTFIYELKNKAESMNSHELFLTRSNLLHAANMFKTISQMDLYQIIMHVLRTEVKLVRQNELMPIKPEVDNGSYSFGTTVHVEINKRIETLKMMTQNTIDQIRKLDTEQEGFLLKYHEFNKSRSQLQRYQQSPSMNPQIIDLTHNVNKMEVQLNEKMSAIQKLRTQVVEKLKETYCNVHSLQTQVLDHELLNWKRSQQLAGNGATFDNTQLDMIQVWCDGLAEIIWVNRTQAKEADRLRLNIYQYSGEGTNGHIQASLAELVAKFTELLSNIVTSTFVIEKQPPQVMKTNTKFTAKVRLLVGGKLNIHMTPPQVKALIISETQANYLLSEKVIKGEASGDILNHTGTMEFDAVTRQLSITFRNMQLKKIKRAEKKGSESVVDEKFSLYFSSQFSVGGGELLVFQVWTLSLPVAVIVHGNQEPHAWATITWDNAFAEPARKPFVVPDKVPWKQVAATLNVKFASATGLALSPDNLNYLAEKAFRMRADDYDSMVLSWSQFSKENLAERNFTFWDWFYHIMKVTRDHLKSPWMDGSILGFVRKRHAEEILANCPAGTFLLRYSDSELGGVTIAWVGVNGDQKEVFMLQPFTSKDFAIRTLADRLNDLKHLTYLYPDIPKEKAFGRYYTPFLENQPNSTNGYVKPFLVTHVPGPWQMPDQQCSSFASFEGTPHSALSPGSVNSESVSSYGMGVNYSNDVDIFGELCDPGFSTPMDESSWITPEMD